MMGVSRCGLMPSVVVDHVGKTYESRSGSVTALEDVKLEIREGEFVSIVGPSGCGKSTLLRIVAGLDKPTSGHVTVDGTSVHRPLTDVGIVFQQPLLLEWRRAEANVMLQVEMRRMNHEAGRQRARQLLHDVGLAGFEHSYPHELSGGMQQRVSLCRALVHDPQLLLMDEPFSALDEITRERLRVDLLALWEQTRKSVLFITHNMAEAVLLSDHVHVMSPRPGTIAGTFAIDLPRPRTTDLESTPEFVKYVAEIRDCMKELGVFGDQSWRATA